MKKLLFLMVLIMAAASGSVISEHGDIACYTVYSDIGAYINNYPIKSYNAEGNTAIIARDLENYGFDILWNEYTRTAEIRKGNNKQIIPQEDVYKNSKRAGMPEYACIQTDITAVIDGKSVPCYNIGGKTVIMFDALSAFGHVEWNNSDRSIRLICADLPMGQPVEIPENPNVVTMYASDGRTITVGSDEVDAYTKVNWHIDMAEVTKTLYSADGRTMTAFLDEIPLYLTLGWYRSDPNRKMVALTFDDGPSKYTSKILDKLAEYNAKATFFVLGSRISAYSDILQREAELGMEIGNHSYSHSKLTALLRADILSQKNQTDCAVKNITGANTTVFRPPYGSSNQMVAEAFNMPVILWSIDTLDWKTRNAQSTIDTVMNNVQDGDIILMHDIYEATANAAVQLIPKLIDAGYELVTVSELGSARFGGLQNAKTYTRIK